MEVVDGMRECPVYINDVVLKWIVWMAVLHFFKGNITKILKSVKLILAITSWRVGIFHLYWILDQHGQVTTMHKQLILHVHC